MAIKVWDGAAFADVENVSYWNGSAWATAEAVHQWDGSAWEQVWPGAVTPQFVGASFAQGSASSLAVNVPAGVQDGDMLYSVITQSSLNVIDNHGSWTSLKGVQDVGGSYVRTARKVASSEPGSYTWTGLATGGFPAIRNSGVILAYRGYDASYADSADSDKDGGFISAQPAAASLNVTGASDLVVAVAISTAANIPDNPAGYTSRATDDGGRVSDDVPGTGATGSFAPTGFSSTDGTAAAAALFAMSPS